MKLKSIAALVSLLLISVVGLAQQHKNTYFFKNGGRILPGPDSADYVVVISEGDAGSNLFNVNEYYIDKTPKLIGKTTRPNYVLLEGKAQSFYPSGKLQEDANYQNGNKYGDEYEYYPNGKLYTHKQYQTEQKVAGSLAAPPLILDCRDSTGKTLATNGNGHYIGYNNSFKNVMEEGDVKAGKREGKWRGGNDDPHYKITFTEDYKDGNLIEGKSVDSRDSKTNSYTVREMQPQFSGGIDAFSAFLSQNIKYPSSALRDKVHGTVILTFVVERDGTLTDIKAVRSPREDLSQEAMRVLGNSPKWVAGVQFDMPVRVSYTVPINFNL